MGKIVIEEKGNTISIMNRLAPPEAINGRELDAIASGCLDKVIPVVLEKSRKAAILKTSRLEMISLRKYFAGIVSKKMFLDVMTQIASLIKNCEKNMMNVNNLYLTLDHILVSPFTKEIKCVYWPIVNNSNASSPVPFLKELPYNLIYSKQQDNAYIEEYNHYFQGTNIFSINSFEKMIYELSGKSQANNHFPSESISITGDQKKQEISANLQSKSADISYNPIKQIPTSMPNAGSVFCGMCGKKVQANSSFCIYCGKKIAGIEGQVSEKKSVFNIDTSVLGLDLGSNGTTVLGLPEPDAPRFPYVIRSKTQEKIAIDKPLFHIGKDGNQVDYCISDNTAISRKHAAIVTRNGRFYLIDMKSTNHCYINDQRITPEEEIEVFPGTKIRLANEDFLFQL